MKPPPPKMTPEHVNAINDEVLDLLDEETLVATSWREILANVESQSSGETAVVSRSEIEAMIGLANERLMSPQDDVRDTQALGKIRSTLREWLAVESNPTDNTREK